jgi:hypothetical protein
VELFNTFLCPLMPPSPMMHGALGGCGVAPHAGRCVFVDPQLPHSIVRKQHGRNDCLEEGSDMLFLIPLQLVLLSLRQAIIYFPYRQASDCYRFH